MYRIALLLVLALPFAARAADLPAKPNIVIFLADDMGFSDLGCYGGEIETPHLNKLAAEGVRFTSFYNTARCWPTRATILTGYYPQQVGMDPQTGRFPAWTKLLPQRLKPLGYRSYHAGKWHVNNARRIVADGGFDRSYHLSDQNRFFTPRQHLLDDQPLPAVTPEDGFYGTVAIADRAIEFLKQHAAEHKDKPFFSYIAFTAPHFPIQALPEDIDRYRDRYRAGWDKLRAIRYERQRQMGVGNCPLSRPGPQIVAPSGKASDLDILGPGEIRQYAAWDSLTAAQKEFQATKLAIHAAMVDRMDREIGRILDQLRSMQALDNTVVFFLSDNGGSAEVMVRGDGHDAAAAMGSAATHLCLGPGGSTLSNTPFRRHKIWVHEGGISTPLIVHWPKGIAARGELRPTAGHVIDLVPTVLSLAGDKVDSIEGAPVLPGRSLVPALLKEVPIERDYLYFNHSGNRALRRGDYKLVSSAVDGNRWSLYNVAKDRSEETDLAEREPDRLKDMASQWEAITSEFADRYRQDVPDAPPRRGRQAAE